VTRHALPLVGRATADFPTLLRATGSPDFGPRTPFSLCFQAQEFDVHKSEAICQARASAQKMPQNPGKTLIFEKSAERCTVYMPLIRQFFKNRHFSAVLHRFLRVCMCSACS